MTPPLATAPTTKADRKIAAAMANDESTFESTPYGRRRIRRWPIWVMAIAMPFVMVYRWCRYGRVRKA